MEKNLAMPGNPRYQPKDLLPIFGYDNLAHTLVEVELAALHALHEAGFIATKDFALLTPEVQNTLLAITTSEMDKVEREVTKHDIRALVRIMQSALPVPLRRFVHMPLTSYDVLDTARTLQFVRAHTDVVHPKVRAVIRCFRDKAEETAELTQIGRTHGQHALPITVGFWLATVLNRVLWNVREMDRHAARLVGKISGAVGAYNAQIGFGLTSVAFKGASFEERVLTRLGLKPAPISTQILPPEPLAYYLFSCLMLSATLGQFGRDARHLMRTEIAEIREPFEDGQVGSSTMAHKRNPIHFEYLEGVWIKNKNEFGKVLDTMISEHQRDMVGSSPTRDFPTLIVNLVCQLNTLLEPKNGVPFLSRITVDSAACRKNLEMQGDLVLAEPLYLALQLYGYEGDAHELVNRRAMPLVGAKAPTLYDAVNMLAEEEPELAKVWGNIPHETRLLLVTPERYTGLAADKVREICRIADAQLVMNQ